MLPENVQKEIVQLHEFFEAWFTGRIEQNEENLRRLADVIADEFLIVSPNANIIDKATLLTNVRKAYGSQSDQPYSIRIENLHGRRLESQLFLAVYEEWQKVGDEDKGRLTTVVFGSKTGTPNSLEWLHVHETWLAS